jgi:hypothetical protein
MIKVEKGKYSLEVTWIDDGLNSGVNCCFTVKVGDDEIAYPVIPLMLVRDYNPKNAIFDEDSEMPTEKEALEWLDVYLNQIKPCLN